MPAEDAEPSSATLSADDKLHPGFLIRRLQQVSVMLFLEQLGRHGVTPMQFTVLRLLAAVDASDQVSIARQAALDASTVTDVVCRLEQKGLVERLPDARDRRRRLVRLTPDGRKTLRRARPLAREARRVLFSPLDPQQQSALLELISIVVDHQSRDIIGGRASRPWSRIR